MKKISKLWREYVNTYGSSDMKLITCSIIVSLICVLLAIYGGISISRSASRCEELGGIPVRMASVWSFSVVCVNKNATLDNVD